MKIDELKGNFNGPSLPSVPYLCTDREYKTEIGTVLLFDTVAPRKYFQKCIFYFFETSPSVPLLGLNRNIKITFKLTSIQHL